MHIKLWGVRGSLPSPHSPQTLRRILTEVLQVYENMRRSGIEISSEEFLETLPSHLTGGYGGHTACCEVKSGRSRLIIDAGSGIRPFCEALSKNEPDTNEFHLYLTHFHWDHLIGLPFFIPLYKKDTTVHFYGVHEDLEDNIRRLFRRPNFPVAFENLPAKLVFHRLVPRQMFQLGQLELTPYKLDHPDPSWGLKIAADGQQMAYCVDSEFTRTTREDLGPDLPLYQNLDLMIFDAQYTFEEAIEKINWGHSSGPIGLDLALREGVRRVVFIHHDPSASDETIRQAEQQTLLYYEQQMKILKRQGLNPKDIEWSFGREGLEIQLTAKEAA